MHQRGRAFNAHRPAYLVRNSAKPQTRATNEVEAALLKLSADRVRKHLWMGHLAPNLTDIEHTYIYDRKCLFVIQDGGLVSFRSNVK